MSGDLHIRAVLRLAALAALQADGLAAADGSDGRTRGRSAWPVIEVFTPSDEWQSITMPGRARRTVALTVRLRVADPTGEAGIAQSQSDALALRVETAIYSSAAIAALGDVLSGGSDAQFSDRGDASVVAVEVNFAVVMLTAAGNPALPQ